LRVESIFPDSKPENLPIGGTEMVAVALSESSISIMMVIIHFIVELLLHVITKLVVAVD
jgi:hypothetical protein